MKPNLSRLPVAAWLCASLLVALPAKAQPVLNPRDGRPVIKIPPQAQYDPSTGLPLPDSTNAAPSLDVATGLPGTGTYQDVPPPNQTPSAQSQLYLVEIASLTSMGRYDEALMHCQIYETQPIGLGRAQLLFSSWAKLGRLYPRAMQALRGVRDRDTRLLTGPGGGSVELFAEVVCLNRELQEEDATCALFHQIWRQTPTLACYFYSVAEDTLLSHGEYQFCLNFIGNPQARLEAGWQNLAMAKRIQESESNFVHNYDPPLPAPDLVAPATNGFVADGCKLVEILVATGDRAGAEKIRDRAIELVGGDPRLVSALDTAAEDIKKHEAVPAPANDGGPNADAYQPAAAGNYLGIPPESIPCSKLLMQPKGWMTYGEYERSLQTILRIHAARDIVLLNIIIGDWVELGRLYPPARQSMISIRNRDARELAAGRGDVSLFQEVQTLDDHLGDGAAVYALFRQIEEKNPPLAQACFRHVEPLLKERGQYQTCLKYVGDPEASMVNLGAYLVKMRQVLPHWRENERHTRQTTEEAFARQTEYMAELADQKQQFEQNLQKQQLEFRQSMWDKMRTNPAYMDAENMPDTPPASYQPISMKAQPRFVPRPHLPPAVDSGLGVTNAFVWQVRDMVEILVALGNRPEAEKIRDEGVTMLDAPGLRSAVTDAEANIRKNGGPAKGILEDEGK